MIDYGKHVEDGGGGACIHVSRAVGVRGGQRDDELQQFHKWFDEYGVVQDGRVDGGEVFLQHGEPDGGLSVCHPSGQHRGDGRDMRQLDVGDGVAQRLEDVEGQGSERQVSRAREQQSHVS